MSPTRRVQRRQDDGRRLLRPDSGIDPRSEGFQAAQGRVRQPDRGVTLGGPGGGNFDPRRCSKRRSPTRRVPPRPRASRSTTSTSATRSGPGRAGPGIGMAGGMSRAGRQHARGRHATRRAPGRARGGRPRRSARRGARPRHGGPDRGGGAGRPVRPTALEGRDELGDVDDGAFVTAARRAQPSCWPAWSRSAGRSLPRCS